MREPTPSAAAPIARPAKPAAAREKYCSLTVDEWDAPRCVDEITREEQARRGWSQRLVFEGDRVVRQDSVNGRGVLVDNDARVASFTYRYGAQGRVVEIEGKSRNGVVRTLTRIVADGNIAVWLDEQERPLPAGESRAVAAHRSFDGAGRVATLTFLDHRGRPTPKDSGVYVERRRYTLGALTEVSFYGAADRPVSDKTGVHRYDYSVDSRGEQTSMRFFGVNGEAMLSTEDIHETRYEYDAVGNNVAWSYFGRDGKPTICSTDNAALGRRTVNRYGSQIELAYFDTAGQPITSARGYSIRRHLLDANEAIIEWSHFDTRGAPVARNMGHSVLATARDDRGNPIRYTYLDTDRRPVRNREGYAAARMKYDDRDNLLSVEYLDEVGMSTLGTLGYASKKYEYDGDRQVLVTYHDRDGRLSDGKQGYAALRTNYEEGGARAGNQYFDAEGNEFKTQVKCDGSYEEAQRAKLAAGLQKLRSCGGSSDDPKIVVLRLKVSQNGTPQTFSYVGPRASETTNDCLRRELPLLPAPKVAKDCTTLTLELSLQAPRSVKLVSLGDSTTPVPPG